MLENRNSIACQVGLNLKLSYQHLALNYLRLTSGLHDFPASASLFLISSVYFHSPRALIIV
jgi:hypothetical protein